MRNGFIPVNSVRWLTVEKHLLSVAKSALRYTQQKDQFHSAICRNMLTPEEKRELIPKCIQSDEMK